MAYPAIYISSLNAQSHYVPNTGDVDYIEAVQKALNKQKISTRLLGERETEAEALSRVQVRSGSRLLHLFLNYQTGTGLGHSVEALKTFKEHKKAQIVLTNIEFKLYEDKFPDLHYDEKAFAFFPLADRFTFIDEADRECALRLYKLKHGDDAQTIAKLEKAAIIPVPCTAELSDKNHNSFGKNIAFLGMIRPDKGIEHVIELGQLLTRARMPNKIICIGAAKSDSNKAQPVKDTQLATLLRAMYPADAQVAAINSSADYDALLATANALLKTPPAIAIELHLNKNKSALPSLLRECGVAFIPDAHGASLHNTAKNSFLCAGIPVATHQSSITPAELLPGGAYHGAMIVLDKRSEQTLAQQMIEELKQREADSNRVTRTLKSCEKLAKEVLSAESVALAMAQVYQSAQPERQVARRA